MALTVSQSIKQEHDELHAELAAATRSGGKTGIAAQAVARALHPHFVKEEEYALPPLGILVQLMEGELPPDWDAVTVMTEKLKQDLSNMLHDHAAIVIELHKLIETAKSEEKIEYVHLAEKIILHAQTEEEVFYPSAILVGEYLRMRQEAGKVSLVGHHR